MDGKNRYDLGNDSVLKLSFALALPTAVAQAVMVLYAIIDRMYIGHIRVDGDLALAGVGVAAPITTLISSFAVLIGLGAAPVMAMRAGHGEKRIAENVVSNAFWLLAAISAVITPIAYLARDRMLMAFGASGNTIGYASSYLGIYVLGTPFAIFSTGLNYFLINQGQSRKAMTAVLSGALCNIILDPLFIFVLDMGVDGAAAATVISQALQTALTVVFLRSESCIVGLRLVKPENMLRTSLTTMRFGLSPFIIIATDSILMVLLNTMLQKYGGGESGDMLITAGTIIQSYHLLVMNPLGGITGGCQGLISYNYGAGNTLRVKKAILCTQLWATLYTCVMFMLTFTATEAFVHLFTPDDTVASYTAGYLRIFEMMIIPLSFQYQNVDSLTALGQIRFSLPISLFRKAVFLSALLTLPAIFGAGASFFAEPVCDLISAMVSTTLLWTNIDRILEKRQMEGLKV